MRLLEVVIDYYTLKITRKVCDRLNQKGNEIEKELMYMDKIEVTKTKWLWYPYIPYGKVTIVHGDPGEGKTTLILNIAAALTRGEMLGTDEKTEPVNVIYQTAEDGISDTVKPRLMSANADCRRVIVINESKQALSMLDKRLEDAIAYTNAKLVILDPMQAYLGAKVDMYRANEVRPIMTHLANIAEKYGCAIVLIGHLNKATEMKSNYWGNGSIDFSAAARSVLIVARDKSNPTVRIVAHKKSSLAPEGKTVTFELDHDNGFEYIGEYECDIDDILLGVSSTSKMQLAKDLLEDVLCNGEIQQKIISEKAKSEHISNRTLNEAKKQLKIQSVKKSDGWYWTMPS